MLIVAQHAQRLPLRATSGAGRRGGKFKTAAAKTTAACQLARLLSRSRRLASKAAPAVESIASHVHLQASEQTTCKLCHVSLAPFCSAKLRKASSPLRDGSSLRVGRRVVRSPVYDSSYARAKCQPPSGRPLAIGQCNVDLEEQLKLTLDCVASVCVAPNWLSLRN